MIPETDIEIETEIEHPLRTVLWERIDEPGSEWCALAAGPDGWRMAGTVLTAVADAPAVVRYQIALTPDWRTRDARIAWRFGAAPEARMRLQPDGRGRWRIDRSRVSDVRPVLEDTAVLDGLVDIDLGFSPVTNTLPLRRLAPAIGQAVDVTAAWVRFPGMSVEPLSQRYIRLAPDRFRYEALGGSFVAEIAVDDMGLVTDYAGLWRRTAAANAGQS